MKQKIVSLCLLLALCASCGEYNKILKSTDVEVKYGAAKKYFDAGKYPKAITLLEDINYLLAGTSHAEEGTYMLAQAYYKTKDFVSSTHTFQRYYGIFPKGEYAELARYYAAYGLYEQSPDVRLDQTDTRAAIALFVEFLEYYPQSDKKPDAEKALKELQDKLALKELLTARLYYNLGDYVPGYPFPGGNYLSCIITARNAMNSYPYSKYREDFMYYTFKSRYELALKSIDEKKDLRIRDVADEYFSYKNDYPTGKYSKEIQKLYNEIAKEIK
ncbi:outer membrane protein assembly factor BamD [Bacteroidia bacterium]|nr:outer membrane protein assembly factor BamD [Bacteroidia bacterium]